MARLVRNPVGYALVLRSFLLNLGVSSWRLGFRGRLQPEYGICHFSEEAFVLFSLLIWVELLVAKLKLLLNPRVVLVKRNFVALRFLEKLARRYFKHKIVVFFVVEHLECEYCESEVLFFWILSNLIVWLDRHLACIDAIDLVRLYKLRLSGFGFKQVDPWWLFFILEGVSDSHAHA